MTRHRIVVIPNEVRDLYIWYRNNGFVIQYTGYFFLILFAVFVYCNSPFWPVAQSHDLYPHTMNIGVEARLTFSWWDHTRSHIRVSASTERP